MYPITMIPSQTHNKVFVLLNFMRSIADPKSSTTSAAHGVPYCYCSLKTYRYRYYCNNKVAIRYAEDVQAKR